MSDRKGVNFNEEIHLRLCISHHDNKDFNFLVNYASRALIQRKDKTFAILVVGSHLIYREKM